MGVRMSEKENYCASCLAALYIVFASCCLPQDCDSYMHIPPPPLFCFFCF